MIIFKIGPAFFVQIEYDVYTQNSCVHTEFLCTHRIRVYTRTTDYTHGQRILHTDSRDTHGRLVCTHKTLCVHMVKVSVEKSCNKYSEDATKIHDLNLGNGDWYSYSGVN